MNTSRIVFIALCIMLLCPILAHADMTDWTHFTICDSLPGTSWGVGGIPLADLDGDGDLDISLSRRETETVYWFERVNDGDWKIHTVDSGDIPSKLGAVAVDIDHDGWMDLVYPDLWFRNPGNLAANPDERWERHAYSGYGHDILSGDISGNGVIDVITFDGHILKWFDTSADMRETLISGGYDTHGGTAPNGVGDLDGDGDNDLITCGYWFENPGGGYGAWARHEWPHVPIYYGSYGVSARSWITDIDADGDQDIIYSDCDTGYGHVSVVYNDGNGTSWTYSMLPDPPTASGDVIGTGSFHSLGVADFDGDGDLDIFAGEQEDPDTYMVPEGKLPMKPVGLKERGVIWENNGAAKPEFTPVVIHTDNPGWHDTVLGDVDGDGDIDMVTKIWNKDGALYHADYWRNDMK